MNSGIISEPFTVWLTGLSGVGKTTLAEWLQAELTGMILDGDELRKSSAHLPPYLHPFCKEARAANVIHAATLAKKIMDEGRNAFVALISPDRTAREQAMAILQHRSLVVHLKCPWHELQKRDTKKIYRRAINRKLDHVCGINYLHEEPTSYENALTVDTSVMCTPCCGRLVVQTLRSRRWLRT